VAKIQKAALAVLRCKSLMLRHAPCRFDSYTVHIKYQSLSASDCGTAKNHRKITNIAGPLTWRGMRTKTRRCETECDGLSKGSNSVGSAKTRKMSVMCGRYRRTTREDELARQYNIPIPPQRDLPISYNIAPSQNVLAIRFNPETIQRSYYPGGW
jgi:SOS response associated peptidase (SRAP)